MVRKWLQASYSKLPLMRFRHLFFPFLLIVSTVKAHAQEADEKVQMADGLRSSGKIYVVVAVLLTVLIGLILYLVKLDKKISRLEKENKV